MAARRRRLASARQSLPMLTRLGSVSRPTSAPPWQNCPQPFETPLFRRHHGQRHVQAHHAGAHGEKDDTEAAGDGEACSACLAPSGLLSPDHALLPPKACAIDAKTITEYENGKAIPNPAIINKLERALGAKLRPQKGKGKGKK